MDGQYHKDEFEFTFSQKKTISEWIIDSIRNKKWKDGHDLHIDEIIQAEISENFWVEISLSLLSYTDNELSRLGYEDIIPIVFIPLYGDEHERGINFENIYEIEPELDITPPSLFVCSINWEGFINAYANREIIGTIQIEDNSFSIYYYEQMHNNGLEYVRNISVLPKKV